MNETAIKHIVVVVVVSAATAVNEWKYQCL